MKAVKKQYLFAWLKNGQVVHSDFYPTETVFFV